MVVYTDGINEALDDEGNEFGQEQLKAVLQSAGTQSVDFLVKTIVERVQNFSSGHPHRMTTSPSRPSNDPIKRHE